MYFSCYIEVMFVIVEMVVQLLVFVGYQGGIVVWLVVLWIILEQWEYVVEFVVMMYVLIDDSVRIFFIWWVVFLYLGEYCGNVQYCFFIVDVSMVLLCNLCGWVVLWGDCFWMQQVYIDFCDVICCGDGDVVECFVWEMYYV